MLPRRSSERSRQDLGEQYALLSDPSAPFYLPHQGNRLAMTNKAGFANKEDTRLKNHKEVTTP